MRVLGLRRNFSQEPPGTLHGITAALRASRRLRSPRALSARGTPPKRARQHSTQMKVPQVASVTVERSPSSPGPHPFRTDSRLFALFNPTAACFRNGRSLCRGCSWPIDTGPETGGGGGGMQGTTARFSSCGLSPPFPPVSCKLMPTLLDALHFSGARPLCRGFPWPGTGPETCSGGGAARGTGSCVVTYCRPEGSDAGGGGRGRRCGGKCGGGSKTDDLRKRQVWEEMCEEVWTKV